MTGRQNKYDAQTRPAFKSGRRSAAALMCFGLTISMASIAQDSASLVDSGAIAKVSAVAAPSMSVSVMNHGAVAEPAAVEHQATAANESTKNHITGLEPGTLALIGFGLIALAATRRNAR